MNKLMRILFYVIIPIAGGILLAELFPGWSLILLGVYALVYIIKTLYKEIITK